MRPGYFFIWIPIIAFAAFCAYAAQDPWAFLIIGFWPAILGWRLTVRFRDTSESEHRQKSAGPAAANLSREPK